MSRPNAPYGQQQPVSYKTVPGRNRTQKWQQAKTYNYDGDEWGGYDPYDEYGSYDEPAPPQAPYGQQPVQRQNSFDAGDERRQFSGSQAAYGPDRRASPAVSDNTAGARGSGDNSMGSTSSGEYDRRARDRNFTNPEQVPPPLNTHASPRSSAGQPSSAFPLRKSSMSQSSSPAREPLSAPATAKNMDKPLPFIRPSDIYRRMAEEKERERQSLDSSRPSMDSVRREAASPSSANIPTSVPQERSRYQSTMDRQEPAEPTSSGNTSEVGPDSQQEAEYRPLSSLQQQDGSFGEPVNKVGTNASPVLPPVSRFSGFGSDFIHSSSGESREGSGAGSNPAWAHHDPQSTIARVLNAPVIGSEKDFASTQSTRAPPAQDPANDSLTERQHTSPTETGFAPTQLTRAPTGQDPAGDILAERQHTVPVEAIGRTRAPTGQDPAGDILSERQHPIPVEAVGRNNLQHQPSTASTGFRSAVNTAFDRKDDSSVPATPVSRDNSQSMGSGGGISRSDTTSTAGISPIMSRVPPAATVRPGDVQVPPIAEEPASATTPTHARVASGNASLGSSPQHYQISRKPSPSHSRSSSAEIPAASVQRGYRRSLEPPSQDNSPARTPALEDGTNKRLSAPMAAETFAPIEEPDVADQAAEVPTAHLEPAETPASEMSKPVPSSIADHAASAIRTRDRSGTDYSTREVDLANTVNLSPDTPSYSPPVAEASAATQQTFLRMHTSSPTSPSSPGFVRPVSPAIAAQGLGIVRATTPGSMNGATSGRDSPAKGRVREIAGNYNSLDDASRRNSAVSVSSSKSSWSKFGGSEENLGLRRKGTEGSIPANDGSLEGVGNEHDEMFPQYDHSQDKSGPPTPQPPASGGGLAAPQAARPGAASQASFRPHLPGEWVSYAPTPAGEQPPPIEQEREAASPVTPRASRFPTEEPVDLTPTTKKSALEENPDFTPNSQAQVSALAQQVKDAGAALGASLMATAGLNSQSRDFASPEPALPVSQPEMAPKVPYGDVSSYLRPALRQREESEMTDMTVVSVASSVPPTPPAKDTQQLLSTDATGDREEELGAGGRPISSYFSGVVAPLKPSGHSREVSRDDGQQRPGVLPTLSTDTGAEDLESDRLRKEIVRSLDPIQKERMKRESIMEETDRTQDALDAPENARSVEMGEKTLPAAEAQAAPRMLDQRFSWEDRSQAQRALSPPRIAEPEPEPEIRPERPWERPRSRNLHIMNGDESDDSDAEEKPDTGRGLEASQLVSPISKSQEDLRPSVERGEGALQSVEPSPIEEGQRQESSASDFAAGIPSYYQSDAAGKSPTPEKEVPSPVTPSTAAKRQSGQRVPGFRDILAIKSSSDRIKTYDSTRQTFADMDTGLQDWLSNMLAQHPEHANVNTLNAANKPLNASATFRHKHSPSIAKFTKSFGGEGGIRKTSVSGPTGAGDDLPSKTPSKDRDEQRIDMDRVQQRGKDLMKNAGVLGGKAQAGAKGLFQRGKSRFGKRDSGDKVQ